MSYRKFVEFVQATAALSIATGSACLFAAHANAASLKLDAPLQPITGWGVFVQIENGSWEVDSTASKAAADHLFELNINTLRTEILPQAYIPNSPSTNNLDLDVLKVVRKTIARARQAQPNLEYFVSIWSPHESFKCSGLFRETSVGGAPRGFVSSGATGEDALDATAAGACTNPGHVDAKVAASGGLINLSALKPGAATRDAYVAHVINALTFISTGKMGGVDEDNHGALGLPVAMSIQNEPGHPAGYKGTYYSKHDYPDLVVKLKSEMDAAFGNGVVQTMVGDVNGPWYFEEVLLFGPELDQFYQGAVAADKTTAQPPLSTFGQSADIIATHNYDQFQADSVSQRQFNQQKSKVALDRVRIQNLGKPVWMTEWAIDSVRGAKCPSVPDGEDGDPQFLGVRPSGSAFCEQQFRSKDLVLFGRFLEEEQDVIELAMFEVRTMLRNLRVYPFERYIWWQGYGYGRYPHLKGDLIAKIASNGEPVRANDSSGTWVRRKTHHFLKRLFQEVPGDGQFKVVPLSYVSGNQTLAVTDTDTDFVTDALAFQNAGKTVLVAVNDDPGNAENIQVSNVPGSSVVHYRIDAGFNAGATQDDELLPVNGSSASISGGSLSFSATANSINILVIDGGTGDPGPGTGTELIDMNNPWSGWGNESTTVTFDGTNIIIPTPAATDNHNLGVKTFNAPLTAGVEYTLSVDAASDDATAILFLFDANGSTVGNSLSATRVSSPVNFIAPGNVAGFYLQVQGKWQAPPGSSPATSMTVSLMETQQSSDNCNLVSNGTFNQNVDFWSGSATLANDAGRLYFDGGALGGPGQSVGSDIDLPGGASGEYTLTGNFTTSGDPGAWAGYGVDYFDSSGAPIGDGTPATAMADGNGDLNLAFTPPANAARLRIWLFAFPDRAVLLDNVDLRKTGCTSSAACTNLVSPLTPNTVNSGSAGVSASTVSPGDTYVANASLQVSGTSPWSGWGLEFLDSNNAPMAANAQSEQITNTANQGRTLSGIAPAGASGAQIWFFAGQGQTVTVNSVELLPASCP